MSAAAANNNKKKKTVYVCWEFIPVSGAARGEYGEGFQRNEIVFRHKKHAEEWVKTHGGKWDQAGYDEIEMID